MEYSERNISDDATVSCDARVSGKVPLSTRHTGVGVSWLRICPALEVVCSRIYTRTLYIQGAAVLLTMEHV